MPTVLFELKKTWWIGIIGILCSIWMIVELHSFLYLSPTVPWLLKVDQENRLRYDAFYKQKYDAPAHRLRVTPLHPSLLETLELFNRLKNSYTKQNDELSEIAEECKNKSEFDLINNGRCRAWWLAVLAKEEIVDIGITLGFLRSEHKLGAIQVLFANGMKGWFKPCGLRSEQPENEIIAGAIDFLMGFNRAPATVMRNITTTSLAAIIQNTSPFYPLDKRYYVLDQQYATCSDNGMLIGAMTGWWTGLEDGISLPKTTNYMKQYFPTSTIQAERKKLPDYENAEQIHSHILVYLLNILRVPGKNEFVSYGGPSNRKYFLGVDLDRTELTSKIREIPTFCEGCLIGNQTLHNLQLIYNHYDTFSEELRYTWSVLGGFTLPQSALDGLYYRLQYTVQCFASCLLSHKPDDVIIPDSIWNIKNI